MRARKKMTTNSPKNDKKWYLFDAKDIVLGRLATEAADLLRGKKKVEFMSNIDCGDYVVVINAENVILTGRKEEQKRYYKHTGYIGNLKTQTVPLLRKNNPEKIIEHAIEGMLPKNKLQKQFLSRLKVYAGGKHPHVNISFENTK